MSMPTQSETTGIPYPKISIPQVSFSQRDASRAPVKGNALSAQIKIMWKALRLTTFPWWSRTTIMGFPLKCHISLIYFMNAGSIIEWWYTEYHGMLNWYFSNFSFFLWVHGVDLSTIGTQTISNWLPVIVWHSSYINSKTDTTSMDNSISEMRSSTFFPINPLKPACFCHA